MGHNQWDHSEFPSNKEWTCDWLDDNHRVTVVVVAAFTLPSHLCELNGSPLDLQGFVIFLFLFG